MKLCQYENEHRRIAKLGAFSQSNHSAQQKFVAFQQHNLHPQVPDIIKSNHYIGLQNQMDKQSGLVIDQGY